MIWLGASWSSLAWLQVILTALVDGVSSAAATDDPSNVGGVVSSSVVALFSTVFVSSFPVRSLARQRKEYIVAACRPLTVPALVPTNDSVTWARLVSVCGPG